MYKQTILTTIFHATYAHIQLQEHQTQLIRSLKFHSRFKLTLIFLVMFLNNDFEKKKSYYFVNMKKANWWLFEWVDVSRIDWLMSWMNNFRFLYFFVCLYGNNVNRDKNNYYDDIDEYWGWGDYRWWWWAGLGILGVT